MNELANIETQSISILDNDNALKRAMEFVTIMATAKTLPKHLQDAPGDCLRVVELAMRTGQSPFALADCTFLVHGRIGFEGKLVAALLNSNPKLASSLDYKYEGDEAKPEGLSVRVSAILKGEDEPREVVCHWQVGHDQSPSNKDLWKRQPAQQLAYWGARVWGRRYAPEVLLGVYAKEELMDERRVEGRVIPESSAPAVPPKRLPADAQKAVQEMRKDVADKPLTEKVAEKLEAKELPFLDCHDDLREKLATSGMEESDFLRFAGTGKDAPKGGYWALADLPEDRVNAAIEAWPTVSKKAAKWIAENPAA